ncbi:MAG: hypothetical protein MZW92_77870 [Comamonadaceae bacterium]|nr:hypothetical protein [Comamonadaceae bacterium]
MASLESYIGLVEVGVGLIPARRRPEGRRAARRAPGAGGRHDRRLPVPARAGSRTRRWPTSPRVGARGAGRWATCSATDIIVFNSHELLWTAIGEAFAMRASRLPAAADAQGLPGGGPHRRGDDQGRSSSTCATAASSARTTSSARGCIAEVMCGGDVEAGCAGRRAVAARPRAQVLHASSVAHPKSQERMMGMMQTGKPVRN